MTGNKTFDSSTYFRVGTAYYKVVWWPLISGDSVKVLIPWSRQAIVQDFGGKVLNEIKSYDGFCNIPSHTSFEAVVNNFLNRYEHIPHKPVKGQFNNTEKFLKHIFQSQYEFGLDYLTILYLKPTQALPVFCLVSRERGTGKTTFLNYLKLIFGPNMTYNKNEDFRSQFNSDWAGKLIIAVDEVLLDKREDSERIKNLSTAKTFKSEAKGKDRSEVEFFGKFILCSNNEDNFIQIDPGETRYWVIKVPVLAHEEVNMLYKLKSEIPAFLYFLKDRKIFTDQKSRMWFDHKLLKTEALRRVIFKNKSRVEIELLQIISDLMDEFNLTDVKFCLKDPLPFLRNSGVSYCKSTDVKEVFQNWGLTPEKNSNSYTRYSHSKDGISYPISGQKGRYYSIAKAFVDEKMNIDDS
jgi:hypothetical protein